jgi:hypothetical protein
VVQIGEEVVCIHIGGTDEFECGAVKPVCARLEDDVQNPIERSAELGGVTLCKKAEFANGIHGWEDTDALNPIDGWEACRRAVHQYVTIALIASVNRIRDGIVVITD